MDELVRGSFNWYSFKNGKQRRDTKTAPPILVIMFYISDSVSEGDMLIS